MINELTVSQKQRLIEVREEWRTIGLSTEPVNRERVEAILAQMYNSIGIKQDPRLIILSSPASALMTIYLIQTSSPKISRNHRGQLRDQLGDQLRDQLWDQLRGQLWDQLRGQLRDQLRDQLWGQLRDQLGDQLRGQLGDQLRDQLWGQLGDQLRDQLRGQLWDQLWSHFGYYFGGYCEVYWIAFYRFCEEIGCQYKDREHIMLNWWEELARYCGWWWPYSQIVIATDKPVKTRWNAQHFLHEENGPAIEFRDGYQLWALNGVRVPKFLVMTPAHDLDPVEWIVKQPNTEIRREAVRKIGIEQVCAKLRARTVDQRDDYELLLLDLNDGRRRPYLKMRNPSIGVYHLEGVPPHIMSVQEALNWRAWGDKTKIWSPETLT